MNITLFFLYSLFGSPLFPCKTFLVPNLESLVPNIIRCGLKVIKKSLFFQAFFSKTYLTFPNKLFLQIRPEKEKSFSFIQK